MVKSKVRSLKTGPPWIHCDITKSEDEGQPDTDSSESEGKSTKEYNKFANKFESAISFNDFENVDCQTHIFSSLPPVCHLERK